MSGTIRYADGRAISWAELARQCPDTLFRGPAHVELCRRLADTIQVSEGARPTLENLLYAKSGLARELSALGAAVSHTGDTIAAIDGPYGRLSLNALLAVDLPEAITVRASGARPEAVRRGAALGLFIRGVAHLGFRAIGWKGGALNRTRAVRTWVEVSLQIFSEEHEDAELLLYPFPLSLRRQWRYWRALRRAGRSPRPTGLPYRLLDLLKVLLASSAHRVHAMIATESRAAEAHARELARAGVREFLTSEEFEFGSWALSTALRENGVRTVNGAHGAGPYCPRVAYDEFRVMAPAQVAYYRQWPTETRFVRRLTQNSRIPAVSEQGFSPVVVFIYQFRADLDLPYERALQERVLAALQAASQVRGLPFVIKGHPNQPEAELTAIEGRTGVPVLSRWEAIVQSHPIVFLIHSTIYFELVHVAPVFVLRDDVLSSELILGDQTLPFAVSDVGTAVATAADPVRWSELLIEQVQRWNGAWRDVGL